jgi:hypothetical protein
MSALTMSMSREQWNADKRDDRGDDDPEREHDVDDDAETYDGDEPDRSIAQGETALHI